MSLLTRLLLISAVLSLPSTPGIAKEIRGAPKAVLGDFGVNDDACRSYHRKSDNYMRLRKDENGKFNHSWCHAKLCSEEIVSHRQAANGGFVLKLKFTPDSGSPTVHSLSIKPLGKDAFRFQSSDDKPQKYIRCRLRHSIAGIGLQPEGDDYDGDYKVYYALAVPKLCSSLEADIELAAQRLWNKPPEINHVVQWDVEMDLRDIPKFCEEVLGAFGENGRIIPNILRPSRKK